MKHPSRRIVRSVAGPLLGLCLCLGTLQAEAATVELSGVTLEDRVSLAGSSLQLNGAGVRYKAVFKVYTAGLYLSQKASTPDEVLAAPGPKRMTITMLREIDSTELGKLFSRGMEDNMERSAFSKLIPGVMRMSQVFSDHKKLKEGETFVLDWIPGTGTVLTIKGKVEGEPFKEPEFFNALMRIWLGPKPADWQLKDALLGKKK
ncbi:chalcone isomerase family protein [Hydrogenophaga taeniospiralis]|uniref:chalcone isomerase family protein n=1 Tax=Hydrogenophaga taeniospiralis TaxID=65656 RepID=UPI001CF94BBB|nr:chalcone isomerase family protein [Hydrogenophaga taeniospiralis]MCB4362291.1 chalcone isomerase family protein [Hydrogenophaga taeniospiralis]